MNQLYLYVALIGVIFVLFALTRTNKAAKANAAVQNTASKTGSVDEELRMMLDEFMNELEQDNARLLDSFVKLQAEYKQQTLEQQQVIATLTARVADLESQAKSAPFALRENALSDTASVRPEQTSIFAFNEKYAKVVELSRQGKTAEQIARETDMGMGEINLVLGLAKREEQAL